MLPRELSMAFEAVSLHVVRASQRGQKMTTAKTDNIDIMDIFPRRSIGKPILQTQTIASVIDTLSAVISKKTSSMPCNTNQTELR